jgi:hypothetical protein
VSSFGPVSFPGFCRPSDSVRAPGALNCPHVWIMPQSPQSLLSEADGASSGRCR